MNNVLKFCALFCGGLLVSLTYYNIKLTKMLKELEASSAQTEELKKKVESYSRAMDELQVSMNITKEDIEQAIKTQAEFEKLYKEVEPMIFGDS